MAAEDGHYARDPTRERADVVIDGTAKTTGAVDGVGRPHHDLADPGVATACIIAIELINRTPPDSVG